jgi:hypothetical protein
MVSSRLRIEARFPKIAGTATDPETESLKDRKQIESLLL